jgi:hypothetical protein
MIRIPHQVHNILLPSVGTGSASRSSSLQSMPYTQLPRIFIATEGLTASHCQICEEHSDNILSHVLSETHRIHKGLIMSYPKMSSGQRRDLIANKVTVVEGWLFCTLCSKRSFSYDNMMPHIQSLRHEQKLTWANAEAVTVMASHPDGVRVSDSPISQTSSKNNERITFACKELKKVYFSIQNSIQLNLTVLELEDIVEKCDAITRHVREIKNRCKTMLTLRAKGSFDPRDKTCIVCLDRPRSRVLLPCNHLALCSECCSSLNPRICPYCRCKIERDISPPIEV